MELDTQAGLGIPNPQPQPIPNPTLPPSTGVTPTGTPENTPPRTPTPTPDTDSDPEMSLKERSVFFPPETFDGKNKAQTKHHWQRFEDFCNQQKLYIEAKDDDTPAATIDKIQPFFQMTLTDLARAWIDRHNFTRASEMKEKFLTDFSPYGKTHRQSIAKWSELKFNPDIDNIDEFLEKFDDLAQLNKFPDDHKLNAFKMAMPREIELHLRNIENLNDCYQTAKDLLTIVQHPVTNKMSTLSLAQSRSPSPQPRTRSPSPRDTRLNPPDRSRPRNRNNFEGFRQYPGQNRPQSIMKRQYPNTSGRGRGRGRGRSMYRSRSMSRPR